MMIEVIIEKTCQDMECKMKRAIERNRGKLVGTKGTNEGKFVEKSLERSIKTDNRKIMGRSTVRDTKKCTGKCVERSAYRSTRKFMKAFAENIMNIMKIGLP